MAGSLEKLRDWIARADGSRRARAFLLLAAWVLGGTTGSIASSGFRPELRSDDALEYAVMARRLAAGEGFTTGVVFPAALHFGADAQHPAVKLPPLWPLVLAGPFALFGANEEVAQLAGIVIFASVVAAGAALAMAQAGLVAGAVASLAVATSPPVWLTLLESSSETLFAATLLLVWLACVRAGALAVGLACGLAYLTRYSGVVVLPIALVLVFARRREPRDLARCLAGFLLVAAPWWIRNLIVAGSPFHSLLNLTPWIAPGPTAQGGSLLFQQEPDIASAAAIDPLVKLRAQLSLLLPRLPLASANLAAFVGVLLGCLRRDGLCLALVCAWLATLLCVALTLPLGSALAPLVPVLLALGTMAWVRHGGRVRGPALGLLLLAPLLPSIPAELPDLALLRSVRDEKRLLYERRLEPDTAREREALRRCLAGRPVVLAGFAPRLVWETDVIAIHAPTEPAAFWRIVQEQPVRFAQLLGLGRLEPERVAAEFVPRPDCGPLIYARRVEPR